MTYPLVQFVSAPAETATVRFDFNEDTWADEETWPEHDGFSLGAPTLEGDPDAVGVEYGFRDLSFNLLIKGSRPAALARQSALAREILRQTNWLRFQLDEFARPVWFKTYRTAPGELSFEHIYTERSSDMWGLGVTLTADPFAYGAEETFSVSVTNDPTAATNGQIAALPTILGDAPAAATFQMTPQSGTWDGHRHVAAVAALPETMTYTSAVSWHVNTAGFTKGTDTILGPGDPNTGENFYFWGGTRADVNFGTNATLIPRIWGTVPTIPKPGRYAAYVRVGSSLANATFTLRMGQEYATNKVAYGPTVQWKTAQMGLRHLSYVHLGEFQFPYGADLSSLEDDAASIPTPKIHLDAGRSVTSATLYINGFVLVPVDVAGSTGNRLLAATFSDRGLSSTRRGVWDGDAETFRAYESAVLSEGIIPTMRGDFLAVYPGATNVLHLLVQTMADVPVTTSNYTDDKFTVTDVVMTYAPRYLHLAGD